MKKSPFALACLVTLTGCYSVPETIDFTLDMEKDYKTVADCAWMKFRTMEAWVKTDLDSMSKSEFAFTNGTSTAGRIDIVATGPGRSQVQSHMPRAVWGKDFWANKFRPIFAACG